MSCIRQGQPGLGYKTHERDFLACWLWYQGAHILQMLASGPASADAAWDSTSTTASCSSSWVQERRQRCGWSIGCFFSSTGDGATFLGENCALDPQLNLCCIMVRAGEKVCTSDFARCYPGFINPETTFANISIILELDQRCDCVRCCSGFINPETIL